MKVIKRDGSTADFDSSKIIVAIQKANQVVEPEDRIDQERIEAIAHYVESKNRMRLLVEDIQDMVSISLWTRGNSTWPSLILFTAILALWCVRLTRLMNPFYL